MPVSGNQLHVLPFLSKCGAQADTLGPTSEEGMWPVCYLLLGRLILEAGVLDVISPDGLVLLILGAQVLHSLGDGQPTTLNVLTADSGKVGCRVLQGEHGNPHEQALSSSLYTQISQLLAALYGNRKRQAVLEEVL